MEKGVTIISNAVSGHPCLPLHSFLKMSWNKTGELIFTILLNA